MEENEIHYLMDEIGFSPAPANQRLRFANFLIDRFFIIAIVYFLGLGLNQTGPIIETSTVVEAQLVNIFISWTIYALIMFLMETFLNGKTIGKFITKTKAVNENDGSNINARTALLRSIIRIIPFEAFSALGAPCRPWHDKWTKTVVIED